jgi:hypothetical protein
MAGNIDLSKHHFSYQQRRDIIHALIWNDIKKSLSESKRDDLSGYIQAVTLDESILWITTKKPIINSELSFYSSPLRENIIKLLTPWKVIDPLNFQIRFR